MARSVNKVILIGNLGQDPELRYTQGGTAVCNIRLATNESYKDANGEMVEKTEWHTVVAWGRLAEICGEYLKKGRQVYFEGNLQTRQWDDKDGQTRYSTEIKAREMMMLSDGGGSGGSFDRSNEYDQSPRQGSGGNRSPQGRGAGNAGGGPAGGGQRRPQQQESYSDSFDVEDDLPF